MDEDAATPADRNETKKKKKPPSERALLIDAFHDAIKWGNMSLAARFHEKHGFKKAEMMFDWATADEFRNDIKMEFGQLFYRVCLCNKLADAKWIATTFNISAQDLIASWWDTSRSEKNLAKRCRDRGSFHEPGVF